MGHGDGEKRQAANDAHGNVRSVAIRVDGEVARLGVRVSWSVVTHRDVCEDGGGGERGSDGEVEQGGEEQNDGENGEEQTHLDMI